jgi:hypothetical protein
MNIRVASDGQTEAWRGTRKSALARTVAIEYVVPDSAYLNDRDATLVTQHGAEALSHTRHGLG